MNPNHQIFRKHSISLYVANKPGVLIRIALLFSRRGFNIDSLVVSTAKDPAFSIMNIVATGDAKSLDQIIKQLNKLVDVVDAKDRTNDDILQHELSLIKLNCKAQDRSEIIQLAAALRCEIVDISADTIILQIQGPSDRLDGVITALEPFGILEVIRTGKVLMARGLQPTT